MQLICCLLVALTLYYYLHVCTGMHRARAPCVHFFLSFSVAARTGNGRKLVKLVPMAGMADAAFVAIHHSGRVAMRQKYENTCDVKNTKIKNTKYRPQQTPMDGEARCA